MAFRMKHWIAAMLVGVALIAIWRLPPESMPPRERSVRSAEQLRLDRLTSEVRMTGDILRSVAWADSLSAVVLSTMRDNVAVTVPPDAEASLDSLRLALDRSVRAELSALPDRSEVVFGYSVQPFDHGLRPGMSSAWRDRVETYVGTRDGTPYCLQVRAAHPRRIVATIERKLGGEEHADVPPRSGFLGACRPYLTHGPPGPGVERWLERGAARFAIEDDAALPSRLPEEDAGPPGRVSGNETGLPAPGPGGEAGPPLRALEEPGPPWLRPGRSRRTIFGHNAMLFGGRGLEAEQCFAGRTDACGQLLVDASSDDVVSERERRIAAASPVVSRGRPSFALSSEELFLLSDLQDEFGPEAFARFWTSNQDVATAFEHAFGTDVGTWMLEWVGGSVTVQPPGPGLPRSASSGAVLTIALLLGVAWVRNRKREVG